MGQKVAVGLFEDDRFASLYPLSSLRPVYEVRCGVLSAREKLELALPGREYCLLVRGELEGLLRWQLKAAMGREDVYVNELPPGADLVLINGRVIVDEGLLEEVSRLAESVGVVVGVMDSELVVLRLTSEVASAFKPVLSKPFHLELLSDLSESAEVVEMDVRLMDDPCDPLRVLGEQVALDFKLMGIEGVRVGESAELRGSVELDDSEGPVLVGEGARVVNSVVRGPAAVLSGSTVTDSVVEGSVVGRGCRLSGSVVRASILMDHVTALDCRVTKSIVGSWTRLMAGACLCGEALSAYELGEEREHVVVGDLCTVGPGAVVYPGVRVGALSSVHRVCKGAVGPFELVVEGGRRAVPLEDALKLAQLRVRESGRYISDFELDVIRALYRGLRCGGRVGA